MFPNYPLDYIFIEKWLHVSNAFPSTVAGIIMAKRYHFTSIKQKDMSQKTEVLVHVF